VVFLGLPTLLPTCYLVPTLTDSMQEITDALCDHVNVVLFTAYFDSPATTRLGLRIRAFEILSSTPTYPFQTS